MLLDVPSVLRARDAARADFFFLRLPIVREKKGRHLCKEDGGGLLERKKKKNVGVPVGSGARSACLGFCRRI